MLRNWLFSMTTTTINDLFESAEITTTNKQDSRRSSVRLITYIYAAGRRQSQLDWLVMAGVATGTGYGDATHSTLRRGRYVAHNPPSLVE